MVSDGFSPLSLGNFNTAVNPLGEIQRLKCACNIVMSSRSQLTRKVKVKATYHSVAVQEYNGRSLEETLRIVPKED